MPLEPTEPPITDAPEQPTPTPSPKPREVSARLRFWRWPIVAGMMLVLMLALFFAQLVRVFDVIEDRLRSPLNAFFSNQITRKFDVSKISIILVDADTNAHLDREDPGRNLPTGKSEVGHRHYHARLLKALAGTAKVVVFDVDFSLPSGNSTDDEEFAAAIKQAEVENTRVLVAVNLNPGETAPRLSEPLKTAVGNHWGIWDGGGSRSVDPVRSIRLGLEAPNQPQPHLETDEQLLIPSLALKAVLFYKDQELQAFLDPIAQIVRLRRGGANGPIVKSIRVTGDCYLAVNLVGKEELGRQNLYHDVYANRADVTQFKNKIVVIGYQKGDERTVLDSEKRYGAEIQANAISNILDDSFFQELGFLYGAAIIVVMIVIGTVLRLGFGKMASLPVKLPFGVIDKSVEIPRMLLAVAGLYIVVVMVAYLEHTVFSITYPLLALGLSYYSIGAVRARLGFPVIR